MTTNKIEENSLELNSTKNTTTQCYKTTKILQFWRELSSNAWNLVMVLKTLNDLV
jgi:hypothetical protein